MAEGCRDIFTRFYLTFLPAFCYIACMCISKKMPALARSECGKTCAHVFPGSALLERAKREKWFENENRLYSFNEAMCAGKAEEKIFSDAFVAARARDLKTTAEEYARTVISPLGGVPGEPALALWFGSDMFCQINFITFLAWLEQSGYAGEVYFCRLEEDKDDVAEAFLPVRLRGCDEIYRDVLLLKKTPRLPLFPVTERGVRLYLGYRKKDSPIRRAIRAHLGEKDLLSRLLSSFPEYGLGDTQYLELIEEETSRR